MIEKAIAASLEPIVEEIVSIDRKVDALAKRLSDLPVALDGKDGRDGRDGESVNKEEVIKDILAVLPVPKDGAPGADGSDGRDGRDGASVNQDEVIKTLLSMIRQPKDGSDGKPGVNGIGIKSVEISGDGRVMTLVLDNDQEVNVELPQGVKGDTGADGRAGIDGRDGKDGEQGPTGPTGLGLDTKAWTPDAVYREGTHVTAALGKVYKAVKDTASKPGPSSPDWERQGTWGFECPA